MSLRAKEKSLVGQSAVFYAGDEVLGGGSIGLALR